MRQSLFMNWCNHMQQANIQFRSDIARVEVSHMAHSLFGKFDIGHIISLA